MLARVYKYLLPPPPLSHHDDVARCVALQFYRIIVYGFGTHNAVRGLRHRKRIPCTLGGLSWAFTGAYPRLVIMEGGPPFTSTPPSLAPRSQ